MTETLLTCTSVVVITILNVDTLNFNLFSQQTKMQIDVFSINKSFSLFRPPKLVVLEKDAAKMV